MTRTQLAVLMKDTKMQKNSLDVAKFVLCDGKSLTDASYKFNMKKQQVWAIVNRVTLDWEENRAKLLRDKKRKG